VTEEHRPEAEEERPEKGARRKVKVTDKRVSARDAEPEASTTEAEVEAPEADHPVEGATDARAEAAEYLDHLKRLKAEFDNYRKRVLKEQTRAVEFATEPIMTRLLEVLDEFELAVMAAERKPEFEQFLRGVEMVYAKLKEILRAEGLEAIDAQGKPFDPEVHEALLQSDDAGEGEPFVSDVLRTGYRLKGRVLRPAGVKVARR
jgi:molecular chaperone GrpE